MGILVNIAWQNGLCVGTFWMKHNLLIIGNICPQKNRKPSIRKLDLSGLMNYIV